MGRDSSSRFEHYASGRGPRHSDSVDARSLVFVDECSPVAFQAPEYGAKEAETTKAPKMQRPGLRLLQCEYVPYTYSSTHTICGTSCVLTAGGVRSACTTCRWKTF